ncbi:phosphoenolpyruvate synthase [Vibrio albus]|uniref:Phosphoenolpyruvate synthase n=1 Tax=Vibrio albus TaxID=2200953 RepID=A0A2U3BBL2_9VIBR|nr:putative PEP-binding protein [Vibrio albus]PWI34181.1 phosphoenolpyruvate synthase [Vibrio albus]
MSNATQGQSFSELNIVNVLPAYTQSNQSDQLYVSMADLIKENVCYHPSVDVSQLSEAERNKLDSILNGVSVEEHFVNTLYTAIKEAVTEQHKVVRVCLSNIDSYAFGALLGGEVEEAEINPLMGKRGVVRFASDAYSKAFAMECEVIKSLRADGINVELVVPFVRALKDAATIIDRLAEQGLPRGLNGFKLLYSCDVPSSVLLADKLLHYFDGAVINLDHLAQFTLGVDKSNEALTHSFDMQNDAVIDLMKMMAKTINKVGKPYLVVCPVLEQYPLLQAALLELDNVQVAVTA